MAPPPEYDKEPKAPDKSATNISSEESKTLHNTVNDQQTNSDSKPAITPASVEVENNKHVEHLDDGQLKALLDEAITYKCPKDREGKSSLFNELLEEVEQDEQALEAAARELSGGRAARRARGGAGRRALPHSNSLQNLEQEALAAESALRRVRHAPQHHAPNVSARAIHGGSLPSDVDKSFLLGEEPPSAARGAGYLATVRCVNPPPLAERRVSASDANCPAEMELLNRRSKPPFPMTYTARATLEIGSSSVCSGRAVTTTTASNQVRTPPPPRRPRQHERQPPILRFVVPDDAHFRTPPTSGPPERLYTKTKRLYIPKDKNNVLKSKQFHVSEDGISKTKSFVHKKIDHKQSSEANKNKNTLGPKPEVHKVTQSDKLTVVNEDKTDPKQLKLLSALFPKTRCDKENNDGGGSKQAGVKASKFSSGDTRKPRDGIPRGPEGKIKECIKTTHIHQKTSHLGFPTENIEPTQHNLNPNPQLWFNKVNSWYQGLGTYSNLSESPDNAFYQALHPTNNGSGENNYGQIDYQNQSSSEKSCRNTNPYIYQNIGSGFCSSSEYSNTGTSPFKSGNFMQSIAMTNKVDKNESRYSKRFDEGPNLRDIGNVRFLIDNVSRDNTHTNGDTDKLSFSRKEYRNRVGKSLHPPSLSSIHQRNIRSMSVGKPELHVIDNSSAQCAYTLVNEHIDHKNNQDNECVHKTVTIVAIDKKNISTESVNLQSHINNDFLRYNSELKCNDNIAAIGHFETDIHNDSVRSSTPAPSEGISSIETDFNQTQLENISSTKESLVDIFGHDKHKLKNGNETELVLISINKPQEIKNKKDIKLENENPFSYRENQLSFDLDDGVELCDISSDKRQENNSFSQYLADKKKLFQALEAITEVNSVEDSVFVSSLDNTAEKVHKDSEMMKQIKCTNSNVGYNNKLLYNLEANSVEDSVQDNFSISNLDINSEKVQIDNKMTKQVDYCIKCIEGKCVKVPNIEIDSVFSDNRIGGKSQCSITAVIHDNLFGKKTEFLNSDKIPTDAALDYAKTDVKVNSVTPDESTGATLDGLNKTLEKKMEPIPCDGNSIGATADDCKELVIRNRTVDEHGTGAQCSLPELPDNAYVSLTLLKRLPEQSVDVTDNSINIEHATKPKKNIEKVSDCSGIKKYMINKDALRTLLLQNLFKSDDSEQAVKLGAPDIADNEVDSAIPFNCITTSEVVDSCNTTPSTAQSAVAEDPKCRSVISSAVSGLQGRATYGSTQSSAPDEFKKSLDENGNSLQYNSPSGSSQHRKKRKKSSKNETVITSHQIDGYQGNKDLNEVLRFIESNAEHGRGGHKLGRAKHKDDADDKGGKKRSTERRKDKETKMKRATSMEELSRTKLEDLTDKPGQQERWGDGAAGKAERRSWGDDARAAYYYRDEPPALDALPDTDFQTVTKKRKPRRRADECDREPGAGEPPRPARAPSPRTRRVSAPPSDRSNDSNDDMDSVHSLPADAPPARHAPPPAPVSYADIARTRHNIPDLIESCNFYAEGDAVVGGAGGGEVARPALEPVPPAPGDADGYPALEPRATAAAAARRARDRDIKPATPPAPVRRDRKERPSEPAAAAAAAECPAPDVVADRRPPVILLDSAAHARDMDGVTFGFDINEQLLGGPTRRPRCDLIRDAVEGAEEGATTIDETAVGAAEEDAPPEGDVLGGVAVRAGCAALRYVPPALPLDTHHLLQIVDYVGSAWDDVVRCGSGKVRYFSE